MDIDDILNDPLLEIGEKDAALFDMPEDMRKKMAERKQPEHYAERKTCENFADYEPLFAKVKSELKTGARELIRTGKSSNFEAGNYYYVDGIMLYLESVGEVSKASNGMKYARTRCIFENGTESDILLETLRKNVTSNGYAITKPEEQTESEFFSNEDLTDEDLETGYIYVLQSLSAVPEIANQKDLYKIGFTTNTVEERIANAEKEPTYLMAPVKVLASYKVVNMNSHVFETLVHQILAAVNFHVIVTDAEGKEHTPKEWYVVPLSVVDLIVKKIVNGSIINYVYNVQQQCLERVVVKNRSQLDLKGFRVLTLSIKKVYFDEIIKGTKVIEYRELKQTTLNRYTYVDPADGKRYLRPYDILRLGVGYSANRETTLVQVTNIVYNQDSSVVEYHLGKVLEHIMPGD